MTPPADLASRALAARTALLALCDTLAALTHTHAPVAPPAGKYVPKVGDVVVVSDRKISGHPTGAILRLDRLLSDDDPLRWRATTLMEPAGGPFWRGTVCLINTDEVRPATPSELAAAGLAVPPPATTPVPEAGCCGTPVCSHTPAPEAKRPTHIRITGPTNVAFVTVGKVYAVVDWDSDCDRAVIVNDDGDRWLLSNKPNEGPAFPTWEPAPCPPPVEGSVATGHGLPMRDLVASTIYHSLGGVGTLDALIPESRRTYLRTADAVLALLPEVRP